MPEMKFNRIFVAEGKKSDDQQSVWMGSVKQLEMHLPHKVQHIHKIVHIKCQLFLSL